LHIYESDPSARVTPFTNFWNELELRADKCFRKGSSDNEKN